MQFAPLLYGILHAVVENRNIEMRHEKRAPPAMSFIFLGVSTTEQLFIFIGY